MDRIAHTIGRSNVTRVDSFVMLRSPRTDIVGHASLNAVPVDLDAP